MEDNKTIRTVDLPDEYAGGFQQRLKGVKEILNGYHSGLTISLLAVVSANAVTSVGSEIVDDALELFLKTFNLNIKKFREEKSEP